MHDSFRNRCADDSGFFSSDTAALASLAFQPARFADEAANLANFNRSSPLNRLTSRFLLELISTSGRVFHVVSQRKMRTLKMKK